MIRPRAAPYADTAVPVEKSMQEINHLLEKYGAEAVQWTTSFKAGGKVSLQFAVRDSAGHTMLVRIEPPAFAVVRKTWVPEKGSYEQLPLPNWPQSLRLLKAYVKAKLEAVAFGLRDVEQEFLADIVVKDQLGHETTVGKAIGPAVLSGEFRPALADPSRPKDRSAAIDAEHDEVR